METTYASLPQAGQQGVSHFVVIAYHLSAVTYLHHIHIAIQGNFVAITKPYLRLFCLFFTTVI